MRRPVRTGPSIHGFVWLDRLPAGQVAVTLSAVALVVFVAMLA